MKFGLFGGAVARPDPGSVARRQWSSSDDSHGYRKLIDCVVEAEGLGFHGVFLVEHHFTGSAQISASLNLLTYLAARTRTIRLGTAVVVLPWHNPVLLAEQAATVDVLSDGRLDLGVGKGYRPREFAHFCMPAQEAQPRFDEAVDLLRRALSSDERFSHHGPRWHFDDIVVEPPPVQRPHPPLWLAAGRAASLRRAARDGFCLLLDQFATFDVVHERLAVYRGAIEAAGQVFDPLRVAVARGLALVSNEAERERALETRMLALGRMNRLASTDDGRVVSSMASDPDARLAAEEGTLIGTPEEIIRRLQRLREGGVEYVLLAGPLADPAQMRRFASEVMPEFAPG